MGKRRRQAKLQYGRLVEERTANDQSVWAWEYAVKTRLRSQLAHKNHDWIMAGLPRRIQDFRSYLYSLAQEMAV